MHPPPRDHRVDVAQHVPPAGEPGHRDGPAVLHHGGVEVAAVGGEAAGDDAVVGAGAGVLASDRAGREQGGEVTFRGLAVGRRHLGRVRTLEADAVAADVEGVAIDDAGGLAADRRVGEALDLARVGGGPGEDKAREHAEGEAQTEDAAAGRRWTAAGCAAWRWAPRRASELDDGHARPLLAREPTRFSLGA